MALKKHIIVLSLLFIYLINLNSVFGGDADILLATNEIYYTMEDTSSPMVDLVNNINSTCSACPVFSQIGIIDNGMDFIKANGDVFRTNVNSIMNSGLNDFTLNFWVNPDDLDLFDYFYGQWTNSPYCSIQTGVGGSKNAVLIDLYTASAQRLRVSTYNNITDVNFPNYFMVSFVRRGNYGDLWINGINYTNASASWLSGAKQSIDEDQYYIGGYGASNVLNGYMDEFSYYSIALNKTQLQYLYNSGSPSTLQQYPFTAPILTAFIVTWNTFLNNTYSSDTTPTVNFNYLSYTYGTANCTLFRNGSLINSTIAVNNTNTDLSDLISTNTLYSYKVNCSNTTVSNVSGNYNYILDTIKPIINITYPENDVHYNNYTYFITLNVTDFNINQSSCDVSIKTSLICPTGCPIDLYNYTDFGSYSIYNYNVSLGNTNEQIILIEVECIDFAGLSNDTFISFYIDTIFPSITVLSPVDLDYLIYSNDVFFSISYYDKLLWKTNTTISNLDNNSIVYNRYTQNNSIDYKYNNFTFMFNVSDVGYGDFKWFGEAVDKHTDGLFTEIPDIISNENAKTYKLDDGDIKFEYDKNTVINEIYEKDRITQEFTDITIIKPTEKYFDISADNIIYIEDSDYACHMIINSYTMDTGYWYDCEGLNNTHVEKITDNKYRIFYTLYPEIRTISKSLGGLNYINKTLYFTIFDTNTTPLSLNDTVDCNATYGEGSLGYLLQSLYCPDVYVSCNATGNLSLDIDYNVSFKFRNTDKVYGLLVSNDTSSELSCISYIKTNDTGMLIQTNPKYTSKDKTLTDIGSEIDTRQFFTMQNGLAQVYWTKDNLIIDGRDYIFGVQCLTSCGKQDIETNVTVGYGNFNSPITRLSWINLNITGIILLIIALFVLSLLGFIIWRFGR